MKTWKYIFCGGLFILLWSNLQAQEYTLQKLNGFISSNEYHEIGPCVSKDGKTLYFTRLAYPKFERTLIESGEDISETLLPEAYFKRISAIYSMLAGKHIVDPINSAFNQDVWIAHSNDDEFDLLEHPGYPLNNALPNSVCALTPDDEPIVVNQFAPDGGMKKGFSKVLKSENGVWAFPAPIGVDRYHNSGADVSLTVSSDGKVMIMSMEREDSYGKADLYISYQESDGTWTYPENLGRGVNSPFRESAPHLSQDMKTLYFSSDRSYPGRGCDIYMQDKREEDWTRWTGPRKFRFPINSEGDDSHPYFNEATGYLYFTSDRDGTFDIFRIQIKEAVKLTESESPIVAARKEGEVPLSVVAARKEGEVALSIGSKVEFSDIYFSQSKAEILSKSYPALHKLSVVLANNPNLTIRVVGHTDSVGDKELLMQLSRERAEAIKVFLVQKKDIDASRIETVGYGGSKPLNDNSNEKLRKQNRRVEIEVVSTNKVALTGVGTK
ncbi:MAG: outer membrane protein OmpA-like peptidoglycan-associated protein [Saprospiraceae bacterium]|jgi:outer membrane protein OmpA-like peptidoglycan-associated protein